MRRLLQVTIASLGFLFLNPTYALLNIELTRWVNNAIPIAVVPFAGQGQDFSQDNNIAGVISSDLKNSGQFRLLPVNKMSQFPSNIAGVDFPYWRKFGMDDLVIGQVQGSGGQYSVQTSLLNLFANQAQDKNQSVLLNQTFNIPENQMRSLAHHISDLIYQRLLGIRGIFSTRLAYVNVVRSPGQRARYSLEISDADGYNPKVLLRSWKPIMSIDWSPDGKKLAYVSFENGNSQIFMQDITSGSRQLITSFKGINSAPAFSPDGRTLAVVLSKSGSPKIYTVNLSNGSMRQLTQGYSIDTEPSWSPDGSSIVFTSDRGGSPQIYKINLASGAISRVTFDGSFNARASYTPDGKSIVMLHRDAQGNFDIASQDLATGTLKLLTGSGIEESPSIAPNGQMILYASNVGSRVQLAMVSADGRVKLNLPSRDGDVQSPAWSPFLS
ncbi:MAG: Tol-Pal system beta propeller repeat protein TolB [Legionellales bacterium]|nr:Tol-Pal system beta propeller repeat protein TolB [Legionellales bacterium]